MGYDTDKNRVCFFDKTIHKTKLSFVPTFESPEFLTKKGVYRPKSGKFTGRKRPYERPLIKHTGRKPTLNYLNDLLDFKNRGEDIDIER